MLVLSAAAYSQWGQYGWGFFALLFFVPDLSMVGYLVGPRIGAVTYNAVHAYVGPAALVCAAVLWLGPLWLATIRFPISVVTLPVPTRLKLALWSETPKKFGE